MSKRQIYSELYYIFCTFLDNKTKITATLDGNTSLSCSRKTPSSWIESVDPESEDGRLSLSEASLCSDGVDVPSLLDVPIATVIAVLATAMKAEA